MHFLGFHDTFTTKTSLTRVRAVPHYSFSVETLEGLNTMRLTIGIMPSGLPWVLKPVKRDGNLFVSLLTSRYKKRQLSDKLDGEIPSMKPRIMTANCATNKVQNRLREKARRVLEAKELFKDIRAQSHFPDLMTYLTLLDALRKQGYLDQALGLFHLGNLKMHWSSFRKSVKGLQPDALVWTLVINGLCREGLLDEAYKAFRLMEEDGHPQDNCSYNVFIQGFLQNKDPKAVQLISEMKIQGFLTDVQTTKWVVDDDQATNHLLFFCVVVSYVFED
ncbi:hypothetical protein POTOM_045690 [Populus tomentosa]|uniref:Pentatricopeptide repeat-containing protein n=1 Tax=Populus tomentosa TaxID=118781 RepID=A0A8X7YI88_POPTO|nr:hypothetical protein POTOM_045690 [Populus tomentosa]